MKEKKPAHEIIVPQIEYCVEEMHKWGEQGNTEFIRMWHACLRTLTSILESMIIPKESIPLILAKLQALKEGARTRTIYSTLDDAIRSISE